MAPGATSKVDAEGLWKLSEKPVGQEPKFRGCYLGNYSLMG